MNKPPAKVIAMVGLHGSASTWAFNVVRELMIASLGEAQVRATYADVLAHLTEEERALAAPHLVIKSHQGSPELDAWLHEVGALVILSLRDPRDAALSMAQRFKAPLQSTVHWLLTDCARATRLAATNPPIVRYEDAPFDDPAAAARLADLCGIAPSDAIIGAIFDRYRTDAVRAFAHRLDALPPERLGSTGQTSYDLVTHIHGPHIGDLKVGKWRDLNPETQAALTRAFGPCLEALGYSS